VSVDSDSARSEGNQREPLRQQRWRGQVPRDVILIVLGAVLAFAGEEWRDAHHRRERAEVAIESIRRELTLNRGLVAAAREHHRQTADTLGILLSRHTYPDVAIYSNGMWNPAIVTSTAWEAARETGAFEDIPLETVLAIAPAYEAQERYRILTESLGSSIMSDVRRDGMYTVLHDRFAQFVPLDVDFANREGRLLAAYDKALSQFGQHH
jgi:hypothetical protein